MTKISLNVNKEARKEANLRLLKRSVDPSIVDILGGATHVVLYHFRDDSQSWEKSDVEGPLSLAVRNGSINSNKNVLVILNRNSSNNYTMDFTSDFQLQKSDPFLIFKNYDGADNNKATIRGIWFPNDSERASMNDLLTRVLNTLKEAPPPAPTPAVDRNAATASLFAALNIGGSSNSDTTAQSAPLQQRPSSNNSTPTHGTQQPPTLDKKSLQLALLSLIQDERFLDLLHAQYLKVHNARTSRND